MTKSRRVMAVIVAALLIAAMILPGLAVKAEAAEKPAEKPKVEISLVGDNQTFEAGETKTLTVQITNNSGQELNNVKVAPDMSKKKAGDWPFEKDWKQYGAQVSRTTLANWIIYCAHHYFQPVTLKVFPLILQDEREQREIVIRFHFPCMCKASTVQL